MVARPARTKRPPGVRYRRPELAESARAKIDAAKLIKHLQDHVIAGTEMKATQVQAGLGLLKKIVPDLNRTELSGSVGTHETALEDLE